VLHGHRSLVGRTPAATYWFDFAEQGDHQGAAPPGQGDRIVHSGKFNWTYVLAPP